MLCERSLTMMCSEEGSSPRLWCRGQGVHLQGIARWMSLSRDRLPVAAVLAARSCTVHARNEAHLSRGCAVHLAWPPGVRPLTSLAATTACAATVGAGRMGLRVAAAVAAVHRFLSDAECLVILWSVLHASGRGTREAAPTVAGCSWRPDDWTRRHHPIRHEGRALLPSQAADQQLSVLAAQMFRRSRQE